MNTRFVQNQGFTIIELLVVIVVIGILATITIVSYGGITSRANTASAQSAAQSFAQKAEIYNVEIGSYPLTTGVLTSDATKSYYVSPNAVGYGTLDTQPTSPSTIKIIKCGITPNDFQSDITATNLRGLRAYYWSYATADANSYYPVGNDNGSGVLCPAS